MYSFQKLFSADKDVTSGGKVPKDNSQEPDNNLELVEPINDNDETTADNTIEESTEETNEIVTTLIPESAQADIVSGRISQIYDRLMLDSNSPREFPKLDQTEIDKIPAISEKLNDLETKSCREAYDILSPYINRISYILEENKIFDHSYKNILSLEPFKALANSSKINLQQICDLLKIKSKIKDGATPNFEILKSLSYDDISKLLESIFQFLIHLKYRSNLNNFSISPDSKESLSDLIKKLDDESNKDYLTREQLTYEIYNRLAVHIKEGDLTPEELKIFEKLKLISYLEAIINHADQLASQIRDLYVRSFSTEAKDINFFKNAVTEGLKLIDILYLNGNPDELNKKYQHYLAATDSEELKARIQRDLLNSLKNIEKLLMLIEQLLTKEDLDQNFSLNDVIESVNSQEPNSPALDINYRGKVLDPETNQDYKLSIFARPQEYTSRKFVTQKNQARIKFDLLSGNDRTRSSTRVDLSSQGVELDLDFPGAIFVEKENPNSTFAYHYYIDDQISQNKFGMDLPTLPILVDNNMFKKIVELFTSEIKRRNKINVTTKTEKVDLV